MPKPTSDCCATGCKRLWPKVRLGDVCDEKISRIKSISAEEIEYVDIASIDNKQKVIIGTKRYLVDAAPGRAQQVIANGDVLISTVRPNLNAVAIVEIESRIPLIASTGFCVLRAKSSLDAKFLYYFSQTQKFIGTLVAVSEKASYPSVTDAIVKDVEIPLPPLAEQKKIVEKVEKALKRVDALKAQFERMEKSAADYFKAALAETFAAVKGEKVKLGDVCGLVGGFAFRSSDYSSSEKYKVVNIGCVKNCFFDVSCAKQIDFIPAEMPVRCVLKKGDLLTSLTGNIGRVCFVDIDNGLLNQRVAKLDVNASRISKKYLFYLFQTKSFVSALSALSFGSAQQNISPIKMAGIDMMLPTMAAQEDAVSALDAAKAKSERMVAAARRGIEICGKMRKAILAEAFQ